MVATAGLTHDLVINGDGFMLAGGPKDRANYKKKMDGFGVGLTPASVNDYEALNGTLANTTLPFRRAFWGKWTGAGQGIVAGMDGWQQAQNLGQVYDLVSLRPVHNGGGLALVPQGVDAIADASAVTLTANTHFVVHTGAVTVVAFATKIFVSSNPGTNNSGFVLKATAGGNIQGMCLWNNTVLVSVAGVLNTFNISTGAFVAFAPAQTCTLIAAYQSGLVGFNNNQLVYLTPGGAAWATGFVFENNINAIEELNGALYIGTHTALYKLEGIFQPKAPSTAPTVLDYFNYSIAVVWRTSYFNVTSFHPQFNFASMQAWQGYLWFFFGGRLYRAAPVQGKDTMRPEPQPVYGSCVGLRVCGNLLVVITQQAAGGTTKVWANDGTLDLSKGLGWFKLYQGGFHILPFPNAGYNQGGVNAVSYSPGTSHVFTRWLIDPVSPVGFKNDNYGVARTLVLGLATLPIVTPQDLAQLAGATGGKVLAVNIRRVGLEWSVLEGGIWWPVPDASMISNMSIFYEVSQDGGTNWSNVLEPRTGGLSKSTAWFYGNRVELPLDGTFYSASNMYPAAVPAGAAPISPSPDTGWMFRITWGGLAMPILRRAWIDYDIAEVKPQTGRSWEFDINLVDPQIGLDGALDTGANLAMVKGNRLMDLVKSAASVTFTDLDQVAYRVKVVGCELLRVGPGLMPGLAPAWQARVKLDEVWGGN
jgi:hypothetical protein